MFFSIQLLKCGEHLVCVEICVVLRVRIETWTDDLAPQGAVFCAETSFCKGFRKLYASMHYALFSSRASHLNHAVYDTVSSWQVL